MCPDVRLPAVLRLWGICLILLASNLACADAPAHDHARVLDVYVSDRCPHCAAAKDYLPTLVAAFPQLKVQVHSLEQDRNARAELERLSRQAGIWPPGVPTFVIDGRLSVGFGGANGESRLRAFIQREVGETGTEQHITGEVTAGWLGTLSVDNLGLPLFTLALGLLDGFNPCAMWVLLFLLSMLVHLKDRSRMALIASVFVVVSGLVYYAFMAAWLNLFLAIGLTETVRLALASIAVFIGLVNLKDFVALGRGLSLSIPESAKPGLYARVRGVLNARSLWISLISVSVLAVVVNVFEALCTAGIPAIYTAVLTQQALSPSLHYSYLGLYILGYMADDALMVAAAVFALNSRKLSEKSGRALKLLSGLIMLALGLVMLFAPELLW
jgi:glutaredoxin